MAKRLGNTLILERVQISPPMRKARGMFRQLLVLGLAFFVIWS